jgi:CheY-like chemotaxis protein
LTPGCAPVYGAAVDDESPDRPREEARRVARILIVDDEEADRLYLQAILARAGHETCFAGNGQEALAQFDGAGVDVVVTDLQMPEVHGFELITVLRDRSPPPPVIAVSGTGQFQLHMAEALGARWTIAKPVVPDLLLKAVAEALALRV